MSLKSRKTNKLHTNQFSVSVVSPVYNNALIMEPLVEEILQLLSETCQRYELVLIDDASSDNSANVLQKLAKKYQHIQAYFHVTNKGTAATYKELYSLAKYEAIVLFSLDGEWDPHDLQSLIRYGHNYDIVIGKRTQKKYPPGRKIVSFLFNLSCKLLFGVNTFDAGSIKLIRRTVFEHIPIISQSVFDEAERIIRAEKKGFRIGSVPIQHNESDKVKGVFHRRLIIKQAIIDLCRIWYLYTVGKL